MQGTIQHSGQQVMVCCCRGTRERTEQGNVGRDTRQVLEGEVHKLFSPCLSTAHVDGSCCGGFGGGLDYFLKGFQVCLPKDLGCARRAGHVCVQGQSPRARRAVAGTGQEHNPTLPQLQPIS